MNRDERSAPRPPTISLTTDIDKKEEEAKPKRRKIQRIRKVAAIRAACHASRV